MTRRESSDEKRMRRALRLAAKGRGCVEPNPRVGCVIVRNGRVIAEGWHRRFGGDHAEIDALKKISFRAAGATLYVNLEPCAHFGKTPPCVDAVIRAGVARVVIGMTDPNPLTAGRSVRKMRRAGIAVETGVLGAEAFELNRFFAKWIAGRIPYVIAKVAQTADGKIALRRGRRSRITGEAAWNDVQKLRRDVDAVLIGRGTAEIDDPRLNVRGSRDAKPMRVILDNKLSTSPGCRLLRSRGGPVVFFTALRESHPRARALAARGARIVTAKTGRDGRLDLRDVLRKLGELNVTSVLVEGGAEVFSSFAAASLADEWRFIVAPKKAGKAGVPAFAGEGPRGLRLVRKAVLGEDRLWICRP